MDVWSHGGKLYEVGSGYRLPDDAWCYDLVGLSGPPGSGPRLTVVVPDATPDGPFTPQPARDVVVWFGGGVVPWPIVENLVALLESSGDLVEEQRDLSVEATALPATLNYWSYADRRFEVNQFHLGEVGSWCYELYEVDPGAVGNNFVEVRVPDASPESGPFVPMPAEHVTLTLHGSWAAPWPVFRRFLDAVRAAGDIVESTSGKAGESASRDIVESSSGEDQR